MRTSIISILLMYFSVSCASDVPCQITPGRYITSGGTEYQKALEFIGDGKIQLRYATWQPGKYEERQVVSTEGEWFCKDKKITIVFDDARYIGTIRTVGSNPLGIAEDALIIVFDEGNGTEDLINEEQFYKEEDLE